MAAVVLTSTVGLSREDWLAYRNLGIRGSDASVVCGINKYKSTLELWMEKKGLQTPQEAGESAYWGTRLESIVREEFTLRTGIAVIPVKQIIQSKEYPFMLANLDGVCRCPTHGRCVFEAKTANAFKAGEWDGYTVPQEYVLQVQHYLCVAGYNGAYIAVLIGGNEFKWTFIPRDEKLISMLIRYERDFWMHIEDDVPLPPDGSDACVEYLSRKYPDSQPLSQIKLPDNAVDLIHQYNAADEQMGIFKTQKQQAANLLKQMLGEYELGTVKGGYVKWKSFSKKKFNADLLETEQPDMYAKYLTTTTQRRFTVKVATDIAESNNAQITLEDSFRKAG